MKLLKYLPSAVFTVFIFLMMLFFFVLPKQDFSENEKKPLAIMPDFTADTVFNGSFGKDFETYLSDHMPMRSFFIGVNAYYSVGIGQNGSNGIYLGKDGFLFQKPFTGESNLTASARAIAGFADTTEIPVSVMLVPSGGYVLDELLPENHLEYDDKLELDEVGGILSGKADFIRLDSVFKNCADRQSFYYKTDHHWTSAGAYEAYQRYCSAHALKPAEKTRYSVSVYDGFYGTSYSRSALWFTKPDTIELWQDSTVDVTVTIENGGETETFDSMFFKEHLNRADKYPVFLNGNQPLVKVSNPAASGGRLLLVKDSFAQCFVPLLAENYSEIIMVDPRYNKTPISELIAEYNADSVLFLFGVANLSGEEELILE